MKQIEFLNTVRKWSSDLYQTRIPEATRDNLAVIQGLLIDDASLRNEFYDIMNKVGKTILHQKEFVNPLKHFKGEEIEFGSVIEEIGLDKITSKVYDKNDLQVYTTNRPTMKALYNFQNRKNLYDTTRNIAQLRGAFKNEGGLSAYMNGYISNLMSSSEIDEFLIMKEMLKSANYCEVNIPVLDGTSDKTKNLVKCIKDYISKLKYPSRDFNELGFLQSTRVEDLRLIIVEEVMNEIDIEYLATLFNKDLATFKAETVLVNNFNDDADTYAIIVDKDFLQFHDNLRTSREVENARTLDLTYILHIWSIIYTSKFLQAVKIRKEVAPTSATIDNETLTMSIGTPVSKVISITATAPENASYTQYTFSSSDPTKVKVTKIDETSCTLNVISGTALDTVTITATNDGKNSITKTCVVTLEA